MIYMIYNANIVVEVSKTLRTLVSRSGFHFQELGATVKRLAGSVPDGWNCISKKPPVHLKTLTDKNCSKILA